MSKHDQVSQFGCEIDGVMDRPQIARDIVAEIGPDGDRMQVLTLLAKRRVTDVRTRTEIAQMVGILFEKAEAKSRAQKLYRYLQETGRSGVIISEEDDGDRVIGDHGREFLREEEDEDEIRVEHFKITMDGKVVGTEKIENDEGRKEHIFIPEPSVSVYKDYELEKEMGNKRR